MTATQINPQFQDAEFVYQIGEFNDHLILSPRDQDPERYVEIQYDDLSDYEREIYDFLTRMAKTDDINEPSFKLSDVQDKLDEVKDLGQLAHYYYWLGNSHGEIYMAEKLRDQADE